MRFVFLIFIFLLAQRTHAQENYIININDATYNIALDQPYTFKIKGKDYNILVRSKDTLTYVDTLFSFQYPKELKVTKVTVEPNVEQVMVLNAAGSGYLFQAYRTLNPESLAEMIFEQATKENTSYGYTLEKTAYERTIPSGQKLKIIKGVQKYKDNVRTYEVATFGKKDEGFIIVTFNMPINAQANVKDVVALMWQSLLIK